jgi:hypothetical protein
MIGSKIKILYGPHGGGAPRLSKNGRRSISKNSNLQN